MSEVLGGIFTEDGLLKGGGLKPTFDGGTGGKGGKGGGGRYLRAEAFQANTKKVKHAISDIWIAFARSEVICDLDMERVTLRNGRSNIM